MSDIRFNQWLHNSGTGGVSQVDGGHVGIGTTNPEIAVHSGNNKILNVGIVTASTYYGDGSNLSGMVGGGTSLSFNDNIGAYFGNSQDLKIHHDGNHSYIDDQGTGNLRLRSGTLEILNLAGNKTSAIFSSGGGQTLNFNNSQRFVTTNTGAVVTGILTATASLNVKQSGNAYLNLLSTGTGNAGIYMDASNGDIAGSDYCSIYQKNDLDLAITNRKNTANIIFETGGENERLRITSDGTIIFANKLTNSSSFTSHNTNFYGGNTNTGGVRIEVAHNNTTVSGNTASGAWPHHLLLSNYSGNGSADNRMASIGFDIPTTSTHANAVIAYQATAAGTGDLQFHLESGNSISEKFRIKSTGILNAPSQAGFYARMNSNKNDKTGDGSYYTVEWDTDSGSICYDQHNTFSTSTGLYQIPTGGDGVYQFATAVCLSTDVYGRQGEGWFLTNTGLRIFFDRRYFSSTTGTITGFYGSCLAKMTAGQTMGVQIFINGGAKNVDVFGAGAGDHISWFSGRKIA